MPGPRLFIDIEPLREYRQFRLLWTGFLIRTIGNQLTVVAVPLQVYRLTHSSLDVGLVSLAQIGPLLVGSLLGGTIVDAFDRRRLLIMTQILLASTSLGLALNSGYHKPALWPIFLCSALSAGYQGVDSPASTALVVSVVGREGIVGANALWQALFSVGQIAGPAVAGLLLARISINFVYWIDVSTYAASLIAVLRMARPPAIERDRPRELGFGAMVGGLKYLKGHQPLEGIFLGDLIAMTLGMPRALFPAMGLVRFHGGAGAVGLLYAAPGVGALVGALLTGWVRGVKRQGRAVMLAVVGWAVAITLFGPLAVARPGPDPARRGRRLRRLLCGVSRLDTPTRDATGPSWANAGGADRRRDRRTEIRRPRTWRRRGAARTGDSGGLGRPRLHRGRRRARQRALPKFTHLRPRHDDKTGGDRDRGQTAAPLHRPRSRCDEWSRTATCSLASIPRRSARERDREAEGVR